jgi:hypothetical protein
MARYQYLSTWRDLTSTAHEQMSAASATENPLGDKILPLVRVLSSLIPLVLDYVALRSMCHDVRHRWAGTMDMTG